MLWCRAVLRPIGVAHLSRVVNLLARFRARAEVVHVRTVFVVVRGRIRRFRSHDFIIGSGVKSLNRWNIWLKVELSDRRVCHTAGKFLARTRIIHNLSRSLAHHLGADALLCAMHLQERILLPIV